LIEFEVQKLSNASITIAASAFNVF